MLVPSLEVVVSISGASALTVMFSAAPAVIWALMPTVCPTSTSTPSRVTAWKPDSSIVILYTPTRTGSRYAPRGSVTASKLLPDAECTALTVTPGSTAPVASVTMPLSAASWANPGVGRARMTQRTNAPLTTNRMGASSGDGLEDL